MQKRGVFFIPIVFILLCFFITGCGKPKLYSKWRDCEINIDGKLDEWKNALAYYDENNRVSIGFINDTTHLYVCLISRNHGFMEQLMRSGFTVWFDSEGGHNKTFGIHFPLGMQQMQDRSRPMEISQEPWEEIEIIGPGKEERYTTTIEKAEKDGISVKMGQASGYFVYELKVPLIENEKYPYAIGISKNKLIGVGFGVSGINRGAPEGMGMPSGGGGMPGGGSGRGGMGMPGGGGRGGMPGGGMPGGEGVFEGGRGFQLWVTVVLA